MALFTSCPILLSKEVGTVKVSCLPVPNLVMLSAPTPVTAIARTGDKQSDRDQGAEKGVSEGGVRTRATNLQRTSYRRPFYLISASPDTYVVARSQKKALYQVSCDGAVLGCAMFAGMPELSGEVDSKHSKPCFTEKWEHVLHVYPAPSRTNRVLLTSSYIKLTWSSQSCHFRKPYSVVCSF